MSTRLEALKALVPVDLEDLNWEDDLEAGIRRAFDDNSEVLEAADLDWTPQHGSPAYTNLDALKFLIRSTDDEMAGWERDFELAICRQFGSQPNILDETAL